MIAEFSRDRILSWSRQFKIYVEYLVALAITDKLETSNNNIAKYNKLFMTISFNSKSV